MSRPLTLLLLGSIFVMSACVTSAQDIRVTLDTTNKPVSHFRFTPPAIYEVWWQEIAACEHLPLPPEHLKTIYYLVPTRPFEVDDDSTRDEMDAMSVGDENKIYLNHTGLLDELLFKHEAVHLLLWWKFNGKYNRGSIDDTHPAPYYTSCGLVARGQQPE